MKKKLYIRITIPFLALAMVVYYLFEFGYKFSLSGYLICFIISIVGGIVLIDGILHMFKINQFDQKYLIRKNNGTQSWLSFLITLTALAMSIFMVIKLPQISAERVAKMVETDKMLPITASILKQSEHSFKGNVYRCYEIEYVVDNKVFKGSIEDFEMAEVYHKTLDIQVSIEHPKIIVFKGHIY
jgi:hypothetical protein